MNATSQRLHEFVTTELARAGVPGCSVTLVSATGPLWSGGFGLADVRSGRPANPDTVYRLFSGTKLFTAVAVLQLEEQGLLELSDPVERFIPEAGDAGSVTLTELLSHRSGLKETLRGLLAATLPPQELPSSTEALLGFRLVARRPPGTRVEYRNVNYALLGEIITRVSGVPYRTYVQERVLAALGMSARFGLTEATRPLAATGYIERWDPMRLPLRLLFPELPGRLYGPRVGKLLELKEYDLATSAIGGLAGTMPDFGRFLQAQLSGGGAALGASSTRKMQALVATGAAGIESRVGVGLGWKIGRVDGRTFLNHEGGGAGFTSELRMYPEQGVGIALGMNAMRMPKTMRLAHRICEAVLAAAPSDREG
jgi:CubicO group peptidase (beta-lactamase class C family)